MYNVIFLCVRNIEKQSVWQSVIALGIFNFYFCIVSRNAIIIKKKKKIEITTHCFSLRSIRYPTINTWDFPIQSLNCIGRKNKYCPLLDVKETVHNFFQNFTFDFAELTDIQYNSPINQRFSLGNRLDQTHSFIENTIERQFTWNLDIKYPIPQRNIL